MKADPDLEAMVEELERRAGDAAGRARKDRRGSDAEKDAASYRSARAALLEVVGRKRVA